MSRMRDVIRGMGKDVFDEAFDAFNKDAAIATGQFHISNIITRGPADLSLYNANQQSAQEILTLRRERKDRVIIDEEAGRAYTVGPSSFPNGLVRRQIGGATHLIASSVKIIAKGSMDKLSHSEPVQKATKNIGELEATIRGVKQCFH